MISSRNISFSGIVKYIFFLLVLEFQELWPLITQLVFEMGFQKKKKRKEKNIQILQTIKNFL